MKKTTAFCMALLLTVALLAGCSPVADPETVPTEPSVAETMASTTPSTEAPTEAPTEIPTEVPTELEENVTVEDGAYSAYVNEVYAGQIGRYYTALCEKWSEEQYFENDMSASAAYYYEGDALENVGFAYQDLDNDGQQELIIGAIQGAEQDPAVFDIWTIVGGEPVMLAQGGSGNHYVLQYVQEDNMWYVAHEASNNAASFASYFMMLVDGKLEITQGILFDAAADEQNPWFMTYDLDWDASNDEPIDEEMANAILDNNRSHYTALEYIPYSLCK